MRGGPWTWSMKVVHGPGPKWGSMDPWSMFCPHPKTSPAVKSEEKRMFSQATTKFKTEWKGPHPVKHLLSNPFLLFRSSLHLVLAFFDAIDKLPGFSPNLQGFLPWSPGFWPFGVERSATGPLFKWTHIKQTPYIILSDWMAHFVWRLSSHFYCKASLYSGNTTKVTWVSTNYRFHCRWGW